MNQKPNILITGATGFVGGYAVRDLLNTNQYNIYALQRSPDNYGLIEDIKERISWIQGDILDIPFLESIMPKMDMVIHSAALVSFHRLDRKKLYDVNHTGTFNIVNVALNNEIKHFVHISSIAALGRPIGVTHIDESIDWIESAHNTDYAISKRLAELEIYRGIAEGLQATILCPSVVIGTGFWDRGTSLFFDAIRKGLKMHPIGETGYVDVRDVSNAIVQTISKDPINDRIIINGVNTSYKKLFTQIAQLFDVKPPSIRVTKSRIKWIAPVAGILEILLGRKWNYSGTVIRNTSHKYVYDNTRSVDLLSLEYRSLDATLEDIVSKWNKVWPHEDNIMLEN